MGFPRQEYWSGLPFPSPGELPNPGIELKSPVLKGQSKRLSRVFSNTTVQKHQFSGTQLSGKHLPELQETWIQSGLGSSPGEGNGKPLQYSRLENLMDRGAWQATVHGIARVRHDLVLSFLFLYDPVLTSIHWKYHIFDLMDLCQQSDGSAF